MTPATTEDRTRRVVQIISIAREVSGRSGEDEFYVDAPDLLALIEKDAQICRGYPHRQAGGGHVLKVRLSGLTFVHCSDRPINSLEPHLPS